jgi:uncharacterized RDD family membrane protein YckC
MRANSLGRTMSVQEAAIGITAARSDAASYGHWVLRVISFALDELVIVPFVAVGYVLIAQGTTAWVVFGITIVAYGMSIGFYNRCIRMGETGQSWGKLVTGTKLISKRTGKPLGVGSVIIREMCHSVDFVLVIGSLFPLFDARRQSLGDKIAGSVVVNVRKGSEALASTLPH